MSVFSAMGIEAVAEGINGFEQNMGRMQSSIGKVANTTSDCDLPLRSFYIALDAVAVAAVAAGAAIVTSLVGGLSLAIKEAADAEVIWSKLGAALGSQQITNGFALTLEDAQKLAMRFRDLAGGSDEAIASIIEMGLRMGTVTADQMPQFIQNTLDLAAVTGQDYPAAARIMALAMEDPASVFMLLKRNGILYDDALQKQIKDQLAAGHTAKAMSLFMDRLSDAIGGRAANAAKGFWSQLAIMKAHIAETFEEIGNKLLPILEPLIEKFSALADKYLPLLVEWFSNNLLPSIQKITTAVSRFLDLLLSGDISRAFGEIVPQSVLDAFNWLKQKFQDIKDAWDTKLQPALDSIKAWWDTNGGGISDAAGGIGKALGDIVTSAIVDGMKGLSDAIKTGLQWLTDHKEDIITALDDIKNWLVTNKDAIKTGLEIFTGLVITQAAINGMASLAISIGAIAASAGPLAIVAGLLTILEQIGEKQAKAEVPSIDVNNLDIGTRIKLGFVTALMNASQGAQSLINGIRVILEKVIEVTLLNAYNVITHIPQILSNMIDVTFFNLNTLLVSFLTVTFNNFTTLAMSFLQTTFDNLVTSISSIFTVSISNMASFGSMILNAIFGPTFLTDAQAKLSEILMSIFGGTQTGGPGEALGGSFGGEEPIVIPGLADRLATAIQDAINTAITQVKTTIKGWEDIGAGIINGIISGINNAIGSLKAKIAEIAGMLPQWLKDLWDIKSPSKVFEKIGKNVTAGLGKGITSNMDTVVASMKSLTNTVSTSPVVGQGAIYNNSNTNNILPGAQITNNTSFDVEAFAAIVRSA